MHCVFCGTKQPAAPAQSNAKTVMGWQASDLLKDLPGGVPPSLASPPPAAPPPAAPPPAAPPAGRGPAPDSAAAMGAMQTLAAPGGAASMGVAQTLASPGGAASVGVAQTLAAPGAGPLPGAGMRPGGPAPGMGGPPPGMGGPPPGIGGPPPGMGGPPPGMGGPPPGMGGPPPGAAAAKTMIAQPAPSIPQAPGGMPPRPGAAAYPPSPTMPAPSAYGGPGGPPMGGPGPAGPAAVAKTMIAQPAPSIPQGPGAAAYPPSPTMPAPSAYGGPGGPGGPMPGAGMPPGAGYGAGPMPGAGMPPGAGYGAGPMPGAGMPPGGGYGGGPMPGAGMPPGGYGGGAMPGPMPGGPMPGAGMPPGGGYANPMPPQQPMQPPYLASRTAARAGAPQDPYAEGLRLVLITFGILLLVAFVAPLALKPSAVFRWDVLSKAGGTLGKFDHIYLAAAGVLALVFGFVPLANAPRGMLAAGLGLLPLLLHFVVDDLKDAKQFQWQQVAGFVGMVTLVPGLLLRQEYRSQLLPRILTTVGALCVLVPLLVPSHGEIPLKQIVSMISHAPGKAKIAGLVAMYPVILAMVALLCWLPAPTSGGAKVIAWLIITVMVVATYTNLLVVGHIGATVKASFYGSLLAGWVAAAWLALVGYGLATVFGKHLEHA
ncbi:MAG: hypothetical protein R3B06_00960 [Kofleriaceae bacterium]